MDASSFSSALYKCTHNVMRVLSLNWNYGMCSARYWLRFSILYIGIVGKQERSNCVVDMRCIQL